MATYDQLTKMEERLYRVIKLLQNEHKKHVAINDHKGAKSINKRLSLLRYIKGGE